MVKGISMDYESAVAFALDTLKSGLPSNLCYHGVHHTRDDVIPAVERIASNYKLTREHRELLLTAAWFHDIGFTQRYEKNETVAIDIAYDNLPEWGYTPAQVEVIAGIIIATRFSQEPTTLLEEIMVDADMDSLGRADFLEVANNLRKEEEIFLGKTMTDVEWYRMEMRFFSQHRYFTSAQRYHRTSGKLKNFMKLYRLMADAQDHR